MNQLKEKLRLVFVPFLLLLIGFVLVYTVLHWLLVIRLELTALPEDVVKFWLPFALPAIPVILWLRPRFKYLHFKFENARFAFVFILVIAIAVPAMIAQDYMDKATGKLTSLGSIGEMHTKPLTKYYQLAHYYVDTLDVKLQAKAASTDRGRKITYSLFIALPILGHETDKATGNWLGEKYTMEISSSLEENERKQKYSAFLQQSQAAFDTTDFRRFTYLEKLGNTKDRDGYVEAIRGENGAAMPANVFIRRFNAFEKRADGSLAWLFISAGIGCLVIFCLLLYLPYNKPVVNVFERELEEMKTNETKELLAFFLPKKGYYVSPILLGMNILVFIIMVAAGLGFASFESEDLVKWGGVYKPAIAEQGQYWRLITGAFLHAGIIHLLFNMGALVALSGLLEPVVGSLRYLVIYLLAGIAGNVASIWWHPDAVGIGASGAIFGLDGMLLALLLFKAFPPAYVKAVLASTVSIIAYNLVMGMVIPFINNAAHIGGLVAGFLAGIIIAPAVKRRIKERATFWS